MIYTRLTQRLSLLVGAEFAHDMGDAPAAAWYNIQAAEITKTLDEHYSPQKNYIIKGWDENGIIRDLDISAILGVLHTDEGRDWSFSGIFYILL